MGLIVKRRSFSHRRIAKYLAGLSMTLALGISTAAAQDSSSGSTGSSEQYAEDGRLLDAVDLTEVYRIAVENDALLAASRANSRSRQQIYAQARARIFPALSLGGAYNYGSTDNEYRNNRESDQQLVDRLETRQLQYQVNLAQPLLNFQLWYGLKGVSALRSQAEVDLRVAESDLVFRTLQAYLSILQLRDELNSVQATEDAFRRQLELVGERYRSGLIPLTDLLEAQSAYDSIVADRIRVEGLQVVAFSALKVITDRNFEAIGRIREDLPVVPPDPPNADFWVEQAVANNLNVRSLEFALEVARQEFNVKRAEGMPSVSATASYSSSEWGRDSRIMRGDQTRSTQVGIQLSVPLFRFGLGTAENRQLRFARDEVRYRLTYARRDVDRSTRNLYQQVLTDVQRVKAAAKAMESAREAVEAIRLGYRSGTRSITDLLDAESNLYQSEFNHAASRYSYILNTFGLSQAFGCLTGEAIFQLNDLSRLERVVAAPDS